MVFKDRSLSFRCHGGCNCGVCLFLCHTGSSVRNFAVIFLNFGPLPILPFQILHVPTPALRPGIWDLEGLQRAKGPFKDHEVGANRIVLLIVLCICRNRGCSSPNGTRSGSSPSQLHPPLPTDAPFCSLSRHCPEPTPSPTTAVHRGCPGHFAGVKNQTDPSQGTCCRMSGVCSDWGHTGPFRDLTLPPPPPLCR